MKILIVHNYYTLKGGEDTVFEQEVELLKTNHQVETLVFYNKVGWRGALQFFGSIWNVIAAKKIYKVLHEFKPHVVHIHNMHFASGPLIIWAVKHFNIPVVLTLHNYRFICPSGTMLHKGQLFTDSLNTSFPWSAVSKKVYRNSYPQTFWLAFVTTFHKYIGTWKIIDRYITLNSFSQVLFRSSSLNIPKNKFIVKPNFVIENTFTEARSRGRHFLFVGRLSCEKGVLIMLEAFKKNKIELHIAGVGPLLNEVQDAANTYDNIHYLGNLEKNQVSVAMQNCAALIFPSIWYETFGLVIIEAFALGTPVIASNIGSASELIIDKQNGMHFEAGDIDSLCKAIEDWIALSDAEKKTYSTNARNLYNVLYSPEINQSLLEDIYNGVKR